MNVKTVVSTSTLHRLVEQALLKTNFQTKSKFLVKLTSQMETITFVKCIIMKS